MANMDTKLGKGDNDSKNKTSQSKMHCKCLSTNAETQDQQLLKI